MEKKLKVLNLYAGIGGLDYLYKEQIERLSNELGFDVRYLIVHNELNKYNYRKC